jgi:hypothetical protein
VLLEISPAATARLAEGGFSPELGARALRRHLDTALIAPAARLLARAGADGLGGTLTVRAPDEESTRAPGTRLGEHAGDVVVSLWRRAAATGRRMVRGALALGELRRETDRELAMPAATAVRDRIADIEGTLATASRKKHAPEGSGPDSLRSAGRAGLPGRELARLSAEHARLSALWAACVAAQGELRTAEELCIEALARDVDAVDLIDAAVTQRHAFRRNLFNLLTGLRPQRPGITLLVHSPDARAAVTAWVKLVLGAAAHHGWRGSVHIFGEQQAGWKHPWGPPHDRQWADKSMASAAPTSAIVRVAGAGAELLLGLEEGLHRFVGLAGEPCHVWVDLLEPKAELTDAEWVRQPVPPQPRPARGNPMREVTINATRVEVYGEEIDPPWSQLAERLEEAAVTRLLTVLGHVGHRCKYDKLDQLWAYPLSVGAPKADDGEEP